MYCIVARHDDCESKTRMSGPESLQGMMNVKVKGEC